MGEASVDEYLVTGQSMPVRKSPGDQAGAPIAAGALRLRAVRL